MSPPANAAGPMVSSKPIQVQSSMTLPMTAAWAANNRAALAATLRSTLQLLPDEELIIQSISAARQLAEEKKRQLQSGVNIVFTIGVSNPQRAAASQGKLNLLSQGNSAVLATFVQTLDSELQNRGQPAANINPAQMVFSAPTQSNATPQQIMPAQGLFLTTNVQTTETSKKSESSSGSGIIIGAIAVAILALAFAAYQKGVNSAKASASSGGAAPQDAYSAKVAHLDHSEIQASLELGQQENH
jgi:hypothetical protein